MGTTSTSSQYLDALDHYPNAPHLPRLGRLFSGLLRTWEGIGEGFAASRRYHELIARGVPHAHAASKVFSEHFADR